MSITHTYLRAFHAVATHGSFTRAAEALHVTQPTLSGQVKALEERYHVRLFTRFGRRVELTEFGQRALAITRNLFHYEYGAEQLFRSATALTTGVLRVAADSPYIITQCLAAFQRRYPDVQIQVQYGNSSEIRQWIDSNQSDIAIVPNVPQDAENLWSLALRPDQLIAFVSREHVWSDRRSISIHDLADQRVVLREKGSETRSILERALQKQSISLKSIIEVGSREGVRETVASGIGVGVIAETEMGVGNRFVALEVNDAELSHSEYMICLASRRKEKIMAAFLEQAVTTLAEP
ncbi:MAG: LysR substrate-binding domain-containing protein [Pseudomonadota bacterium]